MLVSNFNELMARLRSSVHRRNSMFDFNSLLIEFHTDRVPVELELLAERDMYDFITDAVGEQEAERLIICEFGSIEKAFDHLVSIGSIHVETLYEG
jgi:hypothetical protein